MTERGKPRDYRRAYRLAKALWHFQMVRLDHDDAQELRAIAKRDGVKVAELIRTFITWGLEEYDITHARGGQED